MALGSCYITLEHRPHDVVITVDCIGMTSVTVQRLTVNGPKAVRMMDHVDVSPPDRFFGVDFEVPNGWLQYVAYASDGTNTVVSPITEVQMNHGGDWLFPLGLARDGRLVTVESLKQHTYATDREVVMVLGRPDPVAVHYGRHWFSGSLVLLSMTDAQRLATEQMLMDARILVFCPRYGAGYEEPLYLSIGEVTAERTTQIAFETSRRWTLDVQSVTAPPAQYEVTPLGNVWQDVEDDGLTWSEQKITNTWRSLMGI